MACKSALCLATSHIDQIIKATVSSSRTMTIQGLAQNLATAAEVQFNLMRLIMATLFTSASGEEQSTHFRQETDPDETVHHKGHASSVPKNLHMGVSDAQSNHFDP